MFGFATPLLLLLAQNLNSIDTVIGKGREVAKGDRVTVEYKGTLQTGVTFDANEGKVPFVFTVGEGKVIKGWDQGLVGMKEGGKRVLCVPPAMAYGDLDQEGIPKGSTLIFEVKVLRVDKVGDKPELKIEELAAGTGKEAKSGDTVTVKYKGMFLNGTEFDSGSFDFQLGAHKVIAGFDQGVTGMKVGQKRKITIPSEMAYGKKGAGNVIPPDSTLVFELELVAIK